LDETKENITMYQPVYGKQVSYHLCEFLFNYNKQCCKKQQKPPVITIGGFCFVCIIKKQSKALLFWLKQWVKKELIHDTSPR